MDLPGRRINQYVACYEADQADEQTYLSATY